MLPGIRMRKELSDTSGVALESIFKLMKLLDLSHLHGVKGIPPRLYFDADFKVVEAFNHCEPDALQIYLKNFIHDSGLKDNAILPKEIENTIQHAIELPHNVDF